MTDKLALWIARLGPIGQIKYAPGTFGSLAAIPFLYLARNNGWVLFAIFCAFLALGIWSSGRAAQTLGIKDPSDVVIDEVCGMLVAFFFTPITWPSIAIGFALFRLFDILKPPPIPIFEKLPGGYGIVLDDVAAGLLANTILRLIAHYV